MSDAETIVFDDAGGGNILGGLVIGALCNGRYDSRIIDPEWFSTGATMHSIISSTVMEMTISAGRPQNVILCRSHLFNSSAHDLTRNGFTVSRESIIGVLQERIEQDFLEHLVELGLPRHILRLAPGVEEKGRAYRHLNEFCATYALAHQALRLERAKSNSAMFRQLEAADVTRELVVKIKGRKRRCVECGERVVADSYRCEGAGRIFYVHRECAKWA